MAKTMTGARARISVDGQLVGMFDSVSYGAALGNEGIFTLGRYGAHEIAVTSYETISVSCTGFRIIGQGANVLPKFPKLQDLLGLGTVTLAISDRETGENIMTVVGAVPVNYSTGHNAKSTSKINITYVGVKLEEESGSQDETGDPTTLP